MDARTRPAPRLLYVVTEDWYFLSHRLPMARAARAAGFEVHVATNVGTDADAIEREGFTLHPVRFVRGRLSPLRSIGTILALRRIRRDLAPAIVHHVALQASVLGVVAAFARGGANVYAITGLGHAFIAPSGKARFTRSVSRVLLRFGVNRRRAIGLVQNPDDRDMLAELGVKPDHIVIIPGSGIDADRLRPIPEPDGPVTIAYVGRMLDDKGVRSLIAAFRICARPTRQPGCCSPALPIPPIPPASRRTSWPPGGANPASPGSDRSPTSPPSGNAPISRCWRHAARACPRACWRRPHAEGP